MNSRQIRFLCGLVVAAVFALAGCGRDKVRLRGGWEPEPGTVVRDASTFVMEEGALIIELEGKALKGKTSSREEMVIETKIVSADEFRLVHVVDSSTSVDEILGQRTEKVNDGILQGVPIVGRKKDGEWVYALVAGQPTKEQAKELAELSQGPSDDELLYPAHPVRVGERWALKPEVISAWLGSNALRSSGRGSMELREVKTYQGQKCAHLFFTLQGAVTELDDENNETTTEVGMKGEIYRSLDTFLDISWSATGQKKTTGQTIVDGIKMKVTKAGPVQFKLKTTVE